MKKPYYDTCPHCGSNLDPGEKCDCETGIPGMRDVVICRHCGKPEYYGEMRWLGGTCSCRSCYKIQWERENHAPYTWPDLDGARPSAGGL